MGARCGHLETSPGGSFAQGGTPSFTAASLAYRSTFTKDGAARVGPTDCALLVGRFCTTPCTESFGPKLAFETKRLAWVLAGEQLHALQGLRAGEVAARLKFSSAQEQAVLTGVQRMRVYLLPAADAVLCEWDPFLDTVGQHYGQDVAARLEVHRVALKRMSFAEIQREDPTLDMAALDTAYSDARRSGPAVYLASANRLVDARAFLYHELGLNEHADLPFTQDRGFAEATKASIVPNVGLAGLDYQDVPL